MGGRRVTIRAYWERLQRSSKLQIFAVATWCLECVSPSTFSPFSLRYPVSTTCRLYLLCRSWLCYVLRASPLHHECPTHNTAEGLPPRIYSGGSRTPWIGSNCCKGRRLG